MLTFLIQLYCPEVYHKPDDSIRKHKYQRKREKDKFFSVLFFANVIFSPKRTIFDKDPFFYRAPFPSSISILTGNRTQDRFLGFLSGFM
jgi:hypothetical protein